MSWFYKPLCLGSSSLSSVEFFDVLRLRCLLVLSFVLSIYNIFSPFPSGIPTGMMVITTLYSLMISFFPAPRDVPVPKQESVWDAAYARMRMGPSCEEIVAIITLYAMGAWFSRLGSNIYWSYVALPMYTLVYLKINFIPACLYMMRSEIETYLACVNFFFSCTKVMAKNGTPLGGGGCIYYQMCRLPAIVPAYNFPFATSKASYTQWRALSVCVRVVVCDQRCMEVCEETSSTAM